MTLMGLLIMGNAAFFAAGNGKPDIIISCCGTLGKGGIEGRLRNVALITIIK